MKTIHAAAIAARLKSIDAADIGSKRGRADLRIVAAMLQRGQATKYNCPTNESKSYAWPNEAWSRHSDLKLEASTHDQYNMQQRRIKKINSKTQHKPRFMVMTKIKHSSIPIAMIVEDKRVSNDSRANAPRWDRVS
jgi:hypothetical protein